MLKIINNTNIYYEFNDIGSDITIVLLHGWGQNINMMKPIGDKLNNYNTLYIDLPGFGKSSEPNTSWNIYEYSECIRKIIKSLKLNKIILIGHSFGGKISLIYSSKYNVYKLILLASPYKKELDKLPFKTIIYKRIKNIKYLNFISNIIKEHIGSNDYKNATNIMREVLVKSINIDIIEDIKKIKCNTLLIWGDKDTAVPINRAYELNKLIKNSKLIIYKNCTHYAYLEKINKVSNDINKFIGV